MDNNEIYSVLFSLCDAHGVSGDENDICTKTAELLKTVTRDVKISSGTVTARINADSGLPKITLDAHIDQIGFIVTGFESGGFVRVASCGGIDARLLPGLSVRIHGAGEVVGVFCSTPPHLVHGEENVVPVEECCIDTGLSSEELETLVRRGDSVSFSAPPVRLAGTRVASGALDNRAGAAAVICALMMLKSSAYDITAVFTAQEELGCRGAITSAYSSRPDIALAVDVSFALAPGESEVSCGKMGGGPMVGFSPVLDRELSAELCCLCDRLAVPYTREIMSGSTSTDADKYSISRGGVKTALLSVPIRYMHTPAELCDIEDIASTARLICAFLGGNSEK